MGCGAGLLLLVLFAVAPRTLLPTFKTGLDEWYRRSVHKPLRQRHWNKVAAMQKALPRFSCMEVSSGLSELHAHVITLERLPERREGLVSALEGAGIEHEVFFGTDGIEDISEPLRDHYAGPVTKALIAGQGFRENSRRRYWLDLIKAKVNGTLGEAEKEKLRRRMDFAAKLSQVSHNYPTPPNFIQSACFRLASPSVLRGRGRARGVGWKPFAVVHASLNVSKMQFRHSLLYV
jgi:hypothetical protein